MGGSKSLRVFSTFLQLSSFLPPSGAFPALYLGVLPRTFQMFPKKRPDLFSGLRGWPDPHPLTRCVEIKHGGDEQLGEVEMSARHPESPASVELAAGKGCPESKL